MYVCPCLGPAANPPPDVHFSTRCPSDGLGDEVVPSCTVRVRIPTAMSLLALNFPKPLGMKLIQSVVLPNGAACPSCRNMVPARPDPFRMMLSRLLCVTAPFMVVALSIHCVPS